MNWTEMWIKMFGTTEWLGLNMGFWVSMTIVVLLVVIMNVVLWSIKPKKKDNSMNLQEGHELLL